MKSNLSPAARNLIKVAAQNHGFLTRDFSSGDAAHNNVYKLLCLQLEQDRKKLKLIKSIERKIELKKTLVLQYSDWIDESLKTRSGVPDELLTTLMLWHFDIGDFFKALEIAEYVIEFNFPPPPNFNRDLISVILEECAESIIRNNNYIIPMSLLLKIEQITREKDLHDEVRAKFYKSLGLICEYQEEEEQALRFFNRAVELHSRVGVRKNIERLTRSMKKM